MVMGMGSNHKVSFSKLLLKTFKAKFALFLSLSLFLSPLYSHANNISIVNSMTNVTKILQDKRGFVWLSSQQGLTRLDPNNNINFSLNNQEWPLPYSWIHDINLLDNKLLMATETHGLWLFDTRNGAAEKIDVDIPRQSHYHAVMFKEQYYVDAPNKLYRFDPKTKVTQVIDNNIAIYKWAHNKQQLYIGNNDGLYQLQGDQLRQILSEPITALTALSNAVIAITATKIYRINDDGSLSSIKHNEKLNTITKAYDTDDFFTFSNKGKISKYDGLTLLPLTHYYGDSEPVQLRTAFHDASGVLWLASSHRVDLLNENYITNHKVLFDIPINANEITLFDNEIIVGSYGAGLQNFLSPVFNPDINTQFTKKGLVIFDVLEVHQNLYIASSDGLWQYHKKSKKLKKLEIVADKLVLKLKKKNNLLYIATNYHGLYIYDLIANKIMKHINVANGLPNAEVIDVLPHDSGELWIASSNNISIYLPSIDKITILDTPNKSKVIAFVYADNKVFASTLGDGILVFNQQGDLLAQLSKGHSFTEMLLINGEIWISGKPGLYRLSPINYKVTMIENTQQYSFVSSMLVKDDTLYAIHYSGVLAINLSEKKQFIPNVIISKTTISGRAYLLNKTIEIESGNDVITLDLASLDFRPGLTKKYRYRINNSHWQQIDNNQLTLTGLASGNYHIEIMATNSLGQWSDIKAYTEINVAYPWYWTIELRVIYATIAIFIILLALWLLFLRTKSINHIHSLLKDDMRNCGKLMKTVQRNLHLISTALTKNELEQSQLLVEKSILVLEESFNTQEPDNLSGKQLSIAIPFLADYIDAKYLVKLKFTLGDNVDNLHYELRADVYKVIYEALMSGIFKNKADNFNLTLQEVKHKLWLTIHSDNDSFSQLNSKINFDIESYTIRQITHKHQASFNTFTNDDESSQLVISFPLMHLN